MRWTAEPAGASDRFTAMSRLVDMPLFPPRATRLRREAINCLTIAVREKDTDFAGTLIDEATILLHRAAQLEKRADD